jgi:hypothetical protein
MRIFDKTAIIRNFLFDLVKLLSSCEMSPQRQLSPRISLFDLYYTRMTDQAKTPMPPDEQRLLKHFDTRLPNLSFLQRLLIPVIGIFVWAVIRVLGPTIRFEVLGGRQTGRAYHPELPPNIYAFWHR